MAPVIAALDRYELDLCRRINRIGRTQWIQNFFATISKLGDGSYWIALGLLLIAIRGAAAVLPVLQIAIATIVGVVIYKSLKRSLVRERPYIASLDIRLGTAPLDRYSFPSGHTMHATSLTILIGRVEPALLVLALPFAVLVALSRVILGLHYPSDVLAGAALGASLAMLAQRLV